MENKRKKKKTKVKLNIKLLIATIIAVIFAICFIYNIVALFVNPTDTFMIDNGEISETEENVGYVIREEKLFQGENYKNGIYEIKTEGERVAKGDPIFRYYTNNEEKLVEEIAKLDLKIQDAIEQNQTNIMKDYLFVSGHVYSRRKYKGKETAVMIFRIKCRDYIIDDTTNKVIRGKEKDIIDYTYEFKLVRNVEAKEIVCPSCGYMIQNKEGVVCPHCSSVVHTNTNTWRLADKRVLRQTRRRK